MLENMRSIFSRHVKKKKKEKARLFVSVLTELRMWRIPGAC